MSGQQRFPSSFAPGPPRSYAESFTDTNSPRANHHAATSTLRQGALLAMSDPPRSPPFADGPLAPLNSFSSGQPSPPNKPEHMHNSDPRTAEPAGFYAQRPAPHPPTTQSHPHPSQLPPGQGPLSAYPVSPRHCGPQLPSPFETLPSAAHAEEAENGPARAQNDRTLNRRLDAWGYQDCLLTIAGATRTIHDLAEAYSGIPIPDRLPTEWEMNDILDNVDHIKDSLDSIQQFVKESNEPVRAAGKQRAIKTRTEVKKKQVVSLIETGPTGKRKLA